MSTTQRCQFCGGQLDATGTRHLPPYGEHEEPIVVADTTPRAYRIEFWAPTTFVAYVTADSESAARQAFIDGDVDDIAQLDDLPGSLDEFTEVHLVEVTEA